MGDYKMNLFLLTYLMELLRQTDKVIYFSYQIQSISFQINRHMPYFLRKL